MNFVILRRLSVALVFGLFLAHLPTGPLSAQALGQVSGRVIAAESDSAVADAYIVLTDLNLAVRTDAAGRFVVRGLRPGRHAVTGAITTDGDPRAFRRDVDVAAGMPPLEIRLDD